MASGAPAKSQYSDKKLDFTGVIDAKKAK